MTTDDADRSLAAVEYGLHGLFASEPPVPARFTKDVLRRIQEDRWRRATTLDRVFYGGLCASGVLAIIGLGIAVGAL